MCRLTPIGSFAAAMLDSFLVISGLARALVSVFKCPLVVFVWYLARGTLTPLPTVASPSLIISNTINTGVVQPNAFSIQVAGTKLLLSSGVHASDGSIHLDISGEGAEVVKRTKSQKVKAMNAGTKRSKEAPAKSMKKKAVENKENQELFYWTAAVHRVI
ncbi:hypothetical protein EW146_g8370 [Bondarzewia mesenterica]|uniref:Uncharacterized protein n=1 Tax=Bondarzewia mesenterica TaxID=1095465 RepID=A0A4S4LGP3_9AGAM|nr:hypothetical protein EW146_g8370 [Bondarzewia mesenterica]